MNFSEAYTTVLDYVNRPSQAMLIQAKREVNRACEFLNRNTDFIYSTALGVVTYTSGALTIPFDTLFTEIQKCFSITSLQKLTSESAKSGVPIRIVGYEQIQELRRTHNAIDSNSDIEVLGDGQYVAYFANNGLGLFPVPSSTVYLLAQYKTKLPTLSTDGDSNYLLNYVPDLVITRAVMQFAYYLKDKDLAAMFAERFKAEWEQAIAWNMTLKERVIDSF